MSSNDQSLNGIPATLGRETLDRLNGRPRLLLFDIDGTLAPFHLQPELAAIPGKTVAALAVLASGVGTHIGLVTGRGAADGRRMLPDVPSWVVGNHGAEVIDPSGGLTVNPAIVPYRDAVARAAAELERVSKRFAGTRLENKTWTLSMHYRLAAPDVAEPLRAEVARVANANGLRLMEGRLIYEVRPPAAVDKGTAVVELARALGALEPGASVLFAGDDLTDEDAFVALRAIAPDSVTVRISDADPRTLQTAATLVARDPVAFGEFVEWLAGRD